MRTLAKTLALSLLTAAMLPSAALAQPATPTATPATTDAAQTPAPSPASDSPFSEGKKAAVDSPFDGVKKDPSAPSSLDDAIRAEEKNISAPVSATLDPAPADDPFAASKPALDPLSKEQMTTPPLPSEASDPFGGDPSIPAAPMITNTESGNPEQSVARAGSSANMASGMPMQEATQSNGSNMPWMSNLDEAIAKAKIEKKGVLIIFTGDTPASQSFEQLVNSNDIAPRLTKNFIPVKLDFKTNGATATKYAVKRQPYGVVLNKWGYTVGHIGDATNSGALLNALSPYMKLG